MINKNNGRFGLPPFIEARLAGIVGVFVLASGSFTHSVNSGLIVHGDAVVTAGNILASGSLFRMGMVSVLLMGVFSILYALMLFEILKPVNHFNAILMLIFGLIPVPMFMFNQINLYATLPAATKGLYDQLSFFLTLYKQGGLIAAIFFALWLLPLGLLVYRSGFIPKTIGLLLMIGSTGYLILFIQGFLFPGSEGSLWSNPALVITHLSELSLLLWLLIRGIPASEY